MSAGKVGSGERGGAPAGRKARRGSLLLLALVLCGAAAGGAAHLRAWHHFRAARAALDRYHFTETRDHLAVPLRAWPNSWRVRLLAARAARLRGDSREAEEQLAECQRRRPDDPDVRFEWSLLHASAGDLDPVEDYLREQVPRDAEKAPQILAALAEGYVRMYRVAEARACLEEWRRRRPDDTQALYLEGCLWQQIQRPQMALAGYRRALELDPARDDVRWRLAQCLVRLGLADEAAPHLEDLRRRDPDDGEVAVELARARFKQDRPAEARALLEGVLAADPDNESALVERGRLALAEEDTAAAGRWLRRAVAVNPRDRQALQLLANVLSRQGEADEARAAEDRLRSLDRDSQRLADICLHELGRQPEDAALFAELGALLTRLGYREAGRAWLLRALRQDPANAAARDALAGR